MRIERAAAMVFFMAAAVDASAASFVPTDTVTYSGGVVVSGNNLAFGTVTPSVSYGISDAFVGTPIAADFPSAVAPGSGGPWNFYDDYTFTVGAGSANIQSALVSFNTAWTGISNLQGRIISINGPFNPANNLAAPANGATLVDSWLNTTPVAGINTVNLANTAFGPGTYDLQIRGEVVGASPNGAYGGSITFTPVPLPASFWLLLTGSGLLAGLARRRSVANRQVPGAG